MQPILTSANTITHTRSSPLQPINLGMTGQPTAPQQLVDPTQALQMVLN
jgi:hypothetical protein